MLLNNNQKYEAQVKLGLIDRFASNVDVVNKFTNVGFVNVISEGAGKNRVVSGYWSKPTTEVELPHQIVSVKAV